jgi:hypothetical protein
MRFITILSILLVSYFFCPAQIDSNSTTGEKVNSKVNELKSKKVNMIMCYYIDCTGRMPRLMIPDSWSTYDTKYLFWCADDQYFLQRFDECHEYQLSKLYYSPLNLIQHNYLKIQKEKIMPPEYREIIKGKSVVLTEIRDHTCHDIFEIYFGDKTLREDIDLFDLDTKIIDDRKINQNYHRNQNSLLNELRKEVEKYVALYNKKGAQ